MANEVQDNLSGPMKRAETVGIIYNARVPEAEVMTSALVERLELGGRSWVCSASEVDPDLPEAKETDLMSHRWWGWHHHTRRYAVGPP